MTSLSDRKILVTGAAGAIGSEVVALLLRSGARVAALDKDEVSQPLVDEEQGRLVTLTHGLTDRCGIDGIVEVAERRMGGLDALVHAAAIAMRVELLDCRPDDWDRIMATNLSATFTLCQSVIRRLAVRGGGALVGFASGAGLRPNAGNVPYGASKAGVIGLFRSIALDCAALGVRANVILPGLIDSPLMRSVAGSASQHLSDRTMLGRLGRPAEVAAAAAFLLSDAASFMTGACLAVDGGASSAGLRFSNSHQTI